MNEIFNNSYILGNIISRRFLAKLEEIIEDDMVQLNTIGQNSDEPGEKIGYKELMAIYYEAKKEVNEFFGVDGINDPVVKSEEFIVSEALGLYFRGFGKRSPEIIIQNLGRNYAKPILIHEYTHHISYEISICTNNERILCEGLSIAMEHELAGQVNKSKCSNTTNGFVLTRSIGYLKNTFAYVDNFLNHSREGIPSANVYITFPGYAVLRIAKKKLVSELLRDVLFRRAEKLTDAFKL
jgi:hypothetical protein